LLAVAEWEKEHGSLSEAELEAARRRVTEDAVKATRQRSA
jgi:hypothetical protein